MTELDGMLAYQEAIRNPKRDDPTWPVPSFDTRDWAEEFCKRHSDMPKDTMIGWFANTLMRGYDEGTLRAFDFIQNSVVYASLIDLAKAAADHAQTHPNLNRIMIKNMEELGEVAEAYLKNHPVEHLYEEAFDNFIVAFDLLYQIRYANLDKLSDEKCHEIQKAKLKKWKDKINGTITNELVKND